MLRSIIRRSISLLGMLLVMSLVAFIATRLIPGDPIVTMLGDRPVSQDVIVRLRHLYGLDLPIWKQYSNYLYGFLRGDLGLSYFEIGKPVAEIITRSFLITLKLTVIAFPVALVFGTLLGIAAAYYQDTWVDMLVSSYVVLASSIPSMAVGAFLIVVFSLKLQLLPVAGWGTPAEAVLPIVMIAHWPAASLAKLSRACILEELGKGYIMTAQAKGLSKIAVFFKHAFVNTLVPLSTSMGLIFGHLLEGSFVTETMFNIPGLGRVAVDAIYQRDYPVIMATILLATLIYGAVNLIVDIGYYVFDPRLKTGDQYDV
mgnify:CR=1 FL=1